MTNWAAKEGLLSKAGKCFTQICACGHTTQRWWAKSSKNQWAVVFQTGWQLGEWWHCFTGVITCLVSAHTFPWLKFGLKLKGLSFFVFSISSPAPFPIVTFVAVLLTWTLYFVEVKSTSYMHICALIRSVPDIDTHHSFPLELKFCTPKMPYKMRGDTQKQHQKSRVSEMLPVGSFLC